jgi:hypothetical protein
VVFLRYFVAAEFPKVGDPRAGEFFELGAPWSPAWRDLWAEHGPRIVREFAEVHPGSRPWAWWQLDAPEGRRQTSGAPIERGALHDQVDTDGAPLALAYFAHGAVTFESEPAFLKRHGLLLEGEAGRIKPAQYKPERIPADTGNEAA